VRELLSILLKSLFVYPWLLKQQLIFSAFDLHHTFSIFRQDLVYEGTFYSGCPNIS